MSCYLLCGRDKTWESGRLNQATLGSGTLVCSVFVHSSLYCFFYCISLYWEHTHQFRTNEQMVKCNVTLDMWCLLKRSVKGNFRCSGSWHPTACCFLTCYQPACTVVKPPRMVHNSSCHPKKVQSYHAVAPVWFGRLENDGKVTTFSLF